MRLGIHGLSVMILFTAGTTVPCRGQLMADPIRDLQSAAIKTGRASWGYWGTPSGGYYDWCQHSNRLIPVYTFGIDLKSFRADRNPYRSEELLRKLFGRIPEGTLNPAAEYFDQTDIFRLQQSAIESGKKNVILLIFDGMDWQTTRAAAIYRAGRVAYTEGRGSGLRFQDYRGTDTDFGFFVTSAHDDQTECDVNLQAITKRGVESGGYDFRLGGTHPWSVPQDPGYLLGWNADRYHVVTDSANSATAMTAGVKTFNGSVNVAPDGSQLQTIAHVMQTRRGAAIGVVTNVTISHATPAAAYAHNVSRMDHQDLTRDLLGLPSIAHRDTPLPGVDVLLGCGMGDETDMHQGTNYVPGNQFLTAADRQQVDARNGGRYVIAERTPGRAGAQVLADAAREAEAQSKRLLGVFGVKSGHLPYQTADGDYRPTDGTVPPETYTAADLSENPTLADMTRTALNRLSKNPNGFWLMIEVGDVDWASHDVNLDNTIGTILSGDEAFGVVTDWAEQQRAWPDTVVIVTSDHGHGFVLTDPAVLAKAGRR